MLEIYQNGIKIGEVPAIAVAGRPVLEMSQSDYEAESVHTAGAIYIIWGDA